MTPKIAPDFQNLLPAPSAEELAQLEANIVSHPDAFPPIVVWGNNGNTLIEGHWRYKFFVKHGLPPKFIKIDFETRQEAMDYAIKAQAGRRNLTQGQITMLLTPPKESEVTSQEIASKAGVSRKTAEKAKRVRREADPETVKAVERGEKSIDEAIEEITEEPEQATDMLKGKIPAKLAIVFASCDNFASAMQRCSDLKRDIRNLCEMEGGGWLELQECEKFCDQLRHNLKYAMPHTECPKCRRSPKKACPHCKGTGWIHESAYRACASDADRRWLEARK